MEIKNILSKVDHTLLSPDATLDMVISLCDDAVQFGVASACIPPCYVLPAAKYLNGSLPVCTVVGFPTGYSTVKTKEAETIQALENGADEIDMVINIGFLKGGLHSEVFEEIASLKRLCGKRILKVIIETCLLSEDEKIDMCKIVTEAGADYIKTSTGFSHGGAAISDIVLFSKHIGPSVKIKASGGIRSFEEARAMLRNGADRLGTSSLVKLAKGKLQI